MNRHLIDSEGGAVAISDMDRLTRAGETIRRLRDERTVLLRALARIAESGPVTEPVHPGRDADVTARERYEAQAAAYERAVIAQTAIDTVTAPVEGRVQR